MSCICVFRGSSGKKVRFLRTPPYLTIGKQLLKGDLNKLGVIVWIIKLPDYVSLFVE